MSSKRAILLIFIFLLLSVIFPPKKVEAFSGSGAGTAGDPFQITTCAQLQEISDDLDASYRLENNIACTAATSEGGSLWNSGAGFAPIGSLTEGSQFTGTLNGNSFKVTGLFISRAATNYVGLFGAVYVGGTVSNIGLEDADITGNGLTGGLAGQNVGTITGSYTTGTVTGNGTMVGGLVGASTSGSITNSYSTVSVNSTADDVGGLVGRNLAQLTKSYASGTVNGNNNVGGLVGNNNSGTIANSYAKGTVTGSDTVGGLVGMSFNFGSITNSYSTGAVTGTTNVGGFAGNDTSTVSNSFWDNQTSGQTTSDGGTGKTTAQMKVVATFTDTATTGLSEAWDFVNNPNNDAGNDDVWNISSANNSGYPFLSWQTFPASTPTPTPAVSSSSTSSSSSSPSAPSCTASKPIGIPDLFQIDVQSTTAKLYFTTLRNNISGYTLAYGFREGEERFGANISYSGPKWIIDTTINYLAPNTTYYFKVKPLNDCNGGEWSNSLMVKTGGSNSQITEYYKNFLSRIQGFTSNVLGQSTSVSLSQSNNIQTAAINSCSYEVVSDDSLWTIAQRKFGLGTLYFQIMKLNPDLDSSYLIYPGQVLTLCQ